jgi:O-antigen ligase
MHTIMLRLVVGLTIIISPWTTFDPINPAKFLLLGIIGTISFVFLLLNRDKITFKHFDSFLLFGLLIFVIIATFVSDASLSRSLFGTYGRLFGAVTSILLILTALYFKYFPEIQMFQVINYLSIAGVISIVYGALQFIGIDPAPWENPYSPIVGFLGNPNFQSSFIGLTVLSLSYFLIAHFSSKLRVMVVLVFQLIGIFEIIKSGSIQGLFVIGIGFFTVIAYLSLHRSLNLGIGFLTVTLLPSLTLILFGLNGHGILGPIFSSGTLANRVEYWKSGLQMIKENALFGLGPDQFGTWFRFYRPQSTVDLLGTEVVTDSPHNSIIEFGVSFGFLAMLFYSVLIVYTLFKILKIASNSEKLSIEHLVLAAVFAGFVGQSLISPNQLGLTIWGWVLLGTLNRVIFVSPKEKIAKARLLDNKKKSQIAKIDDRAFLNLMVGSILGSLITLPILYQSILYRNALADSDAIKLIQTVSRWPKEEYINIQVVEILMQNQRWALAERLNKELIIDSPNSYLAWKKLFENRESSVEEKKEARKQLKRLDPLNSEWQ